MTALVSGADAAVNIHIATAPERCIVDPVAAAGSGSTHSPYEIGACSGAGDRTTGTARVSTSSSAPVEMPGGPGSLGGPEVTVAVGDTITVNGPGPTVTLTGILTVDGTLNGGAATEGPYDAGGTVSQSVVGELTINGVSKTAQFVHSDVLGATGDPSQEQYAINAQPLHDPAFVIGFAGSAGYQATRGRSSARARAARGSR